MPEDRLRIMHLVYSLETGGLENGVVNLCNRLDPARFQPSICLFQGGGELESRLNRQVELLTLNKFWRNDPTLPFRLALQLRNRRIDILHTHSWGTLVEGVVAAKLARTPRIVHGEHGVLEKRHHNIRIQRLLWHLTHRLTSVASPLAGQMADIVGYPRDRIQVIPNGVNTDLFSPRPESRFALRSEFGFNQTGTVIGMVARLVPIKNHEGVLRALAALAQQGVSFTLALAGEGPLLGKLRSLSNDLGIGSRVRFLGDLDNVHHFLNALDLFVLNSHSEGMSNTILEAMSCGLPVIATSVGANADLVVEGETGLLIPPDDPFALAAALNTLVDNNSLRLEMGRKGRTRIEREFGIARMVRDYCQLYCELQGDRSSVTHALVERRSPHELGAGSTQ